MPEQVNESAVVAIGDSVKPGGVKHAEQAPATRLPLPDRHRIMLHNCNFWIGVAANRLPFDDHMWQTLRDDFISLREILSVYGPPAPKKDAPSAAG